MDIMNKYKDEEIVIDVILQDAEGIPVTNPEAFTVSLVLSTTSGGTALNGTKYDAALEDAAAARFRRVLSPANLSELREGGTYYYNVWSKQGTNAPVLRASGKIVLKNSISLP